MLLLKYILAGCLTLFAANAFAGTVTEFTSAWDQFLRRYVVTGTTGDPYLGAAVPYEEISTSPNISAELSHIGALLQSLSVPPAHGDLAFWINAYNFAALRAVSEAWPVDSIRDLYWLPFRVWNRITVSIGGTSLSLAYIEHDIVRAAGDARVHFALNCASRSCPDLRPEAYRSRRLDAQLDDQARRFLENRFKGMKPAADRCGISSLFRWYAEDFGDPRSWLRRYGGKAGARCAAQPQWEYLDYDWRVNTVR